MGTLLNAVLLSKRYTAIKELRSLNVTVTETGKPIEKADFDELMYEWRKAAFLAVDVSAEANKWF
ncbi:MAG: hypothetical protein ACQEXB_18580 [Bacillota bacterium]